MVKHIENSASIDTDKIENFLEQMAEVDGHSLKGTVDDLLSPLSIWALVGLPRRGEDLYAGVREGFHYNSVTKLISHSFESAREFASVVNIAEATLNRRKREGRLNEEESDKVYRICRVLDSATNLFSGDKHKAHVWMRKEARGLGNRKPIEMLRTAAEYESVLDYIGRIRHGVFS